MQNRSIKPWNKVQNGDHILLRTKKKKGKNSIKLIVKNYHNPPRPAKKLHNSNSTRTNTRKSTLKNRILCFYGISLGGKKMQEEQHRPKKKKKTFQRIETIQYQIKQKNLQHLNNFIACLIHYGIEHCNLHKRCGSTTPWGRNCLATRQQSKLEEEYYLQSKGDPLHQQRWEATDPSNAEWSGETLARNGDEESREGSGEELGEERGSIYIGKWDVVEAFGDRCF